MWLVEPDESVVEVVIANLSASNFRTFLRDFSTLLIFWPFPLGKVSLQFVSSPCDGIGLWDHVKSLQLHVAAIIDIVDPPQD